MRGLLFVAIAALILVAVAAASGGEWRGYGATVKAWNAHRHFDRSQTMGNFRAYFPREADGEDRYASVLRNVHGHVDSYVMHFAPKVTESAALALLRRGELPADARLLRKKRNADCLVLYYRSAAAKRALGSAIINLELYASANAPRHYSGHVGDLIIGEVSNHTMSMDCSLG